MTADNALTPAVRARRHGLADLLARSAVRTPDKTAVVFGELRQSFAELDALVSRTAAGFAERGVAKGDRVVLLARNSHGFAVAYFALARIGAISVPVNFMLTAPEVAYVLGHCGAVGVVAGDDLTVTADAALTEADLDPAALKVHAVIGEAPGWEPFTVLGESTAPCPDVDLDDDDPVQIMYTSGTESRPKGAVMTSRNLLAQYTTAIV
ncbi:MAG: AMP-binding protein, partial [Streptomycetaceae bacterium]|nr:AMP-binding protein [Streptomycetaceae bacterium]